MVLVDIVVPALARKYHFNLDENIRLDALITEIAGVIEQKEQCSLLGGKEDLLLCTVDSQKALFLNKSLSEQEIRNADTLMLV